ncbi:hypothetical protein M446_4113 [Methylobacterium sp. 4-46]|nr:hypothetical protein M446_4113 [Methylobacterium sp. 4-46]
MIEMPWQIPPAAPLPGGIAARPSRRETERAVIRALSQLDPSLARWARAERRRAALLRFLVGIWGHFRLRATEWFAAALLLQLGWTFGTPPDIFPCQPTWALLARLAPEGTWGALMLAVAGLRIAALTVNGTYRGFRFSPHIRALTAFLACGLWLQVTLSAWSSPVPGAACGIYRLILLMELWNVWSSGLDVGYAERRRALDAA